MLRQQWSNVHLSALIFWYPPDDILEPGTWINVVGLAGCNERVHHGRPDGGCIVAAEQIVLAALCWQRSYVGIVR